MFGSDQAISEAFLPLYFWIALFDYIGKSTQFGHQVPPRPGEEQKVQIFAPIVHAFPGSLVYFCLLKKRY
jgi:hypothetical protein